MLARPCPVIDLPRAVCPVPTCPAPICPVIVRAIRPETGRIRLTIMQTSTRSTITGVEPAMRG